MPFSTLARLLDRLLGRRASEAPASAEVERRRAREEAEAARREGEVQRLLAEPSPDLVEYLREKRDGYVSGSLPRDRLERTIEDFEQDRRREE